MIIEPGEKIVYESREEMIADLERKGYYPSKWCDEQLEHEEEHMKKARELGYNPKYCLGVIEDVGAVKSHRIGIKLDRYASDEDLRMILAAPRELSDLDEQKLRELEQEATT